MKKKILTLDDLYNYYSSTSQRSRHFSAKDDDSVIAVRTFGKIKYDADSDAREGLTPCFLQSCHINLNSNGSDISREAMEKALPSFEFRPILAYIHEVDGKPEFYEHNDGEITVGVISNEKPTQIFTDIFLMIILRLKRFLSVKVNAKYL